MTDNDMTEWVNQFKARWEEADAKGLVGHRVEHGLEPLWGQFVAKRVELAEAERSRHEAWDALYKLQQEQNTIKTSPGGIGYVRPTATKAIPEATE